MVPFQFCTPLTNAASYPHSTLVASEERSKLFHAPLQGAASYTLSHIHAVSDGLNSASCKPPYYGFVLYSVVQCWNTHCTY